MCSHDSCVTTISLISINFATAHLWILRWCPVKEIQMRGKHNINYITKKKWYFSLFKEEAALPVPADAACLSHFRFVFAVSVCPQEENIPRKSDCCFCLHRSARPHLDAAGRHIRSCQKWTGIRCGLPSRKKDAVNPSKYTKYHQTFKNCHGSNNSNRATRKSR